MKSVSVSEPEHDIFPIDSKFMSLSQTGNLQELWNFAIRKTGLNQEIILTERNVCSK